MEKQFNFKTILRGFLDAFNIHRGLIPTIKDLLINPKNVIQYYIEGKIDKYGYNKYFSPGRFFVTVIAVLSVFTFFAAEFSYDLIRDYTLQEVLTEEEKSIKLVAYEIIMFFVKHPMFAFLLAILPATLSTRIIFRKLDNLAKHLVVNSYTFCYIALLTGVLSLFFNQQEYLTYQTAQLQAVKDNIKLDTVWKFEFYTYSFYFAPILYYCFAFKRIFNLSWIASIFKTLVSLTLTMIMAIIILTIIVVITMGGL